MKINLHTFLSGNITQKLQNKYLKRHIQSPLKQKILNNAGAILAILGVYTGGAFYDNSYYKLNKDGYISYVKPSQTNFEKREDAINYAKERIIDALNTNPPYEHMVYINNANNEILAEFKGDEQKVYGILSLADKIKIAYSGKGYTILHGHPENINGETNPLGYNDFISLTENEQNTEIAAVNRRGEVSLLRKNNNFTPLTQETTGEVNHDIINLLNISLQKNKPVLYYSIINAYTQTTDSLKKTKLSNKFDSLLMLQDSTAYLHKLLHKYWHEHAPKLGLEYFTNYRSNKSQK